MSDAKNVLRREIVAFRRNMEESVRKDIDERIYNILIELDIVKKCSTFLVYASSPVETDTRRFIDHLFAVGKKVAVPKCVGKNMHFLIIDSFDMLVKSIHGVDEPENGAPVTRFDDTVCIVPALRYDRNGYRLGWGGGFDDRFLAGYSGISVGICYEENCGDVPKDKYDIPVNIVITENGIYKR